METPGSIFALNKAAQNGKFSKAIADKYENAGTAPYAGISLVFLNLKQNQILQTNTEETIQIIYKLMLQWNNRQDFPLTRTSVFSHIRENIEHDLQTLSCENKELYRELNFIWQEIRTLDRKEASVVDKKRARRRQDYLQRERRKWDEKIQNNLTLIRQTAVQVPAELRPSDVHKAIIHQLSQEQSLRTGFRDAGITETMFLEKETPGTGVPGAKPFNGFTYRDNFHELHRMLEHRLSDKTVLEKQLSDKTELEHRISAMELMLSGKTMQQPLPNETQQMIRQKQIPDGAQEAPAGIQTVDRIVNQQIIQQVNQQISRQLLQTEELAHRITEIREEGITETEFLEKEIPGTGALRARLLGTETETRLRNLSEIFTGFIYRDSFRELYRMLEHRLSDKTILEHRLPGETQKTIRQNQILTEVREAPAGIREISAGIQIENHIANQQIIRQINRQLLQEELPHRITEIREAEIPGSETLRTEIPVTGILGIDPLRTETETRLRSLGELFTGFIYRGSFRELHRTLEHRLPEKTMLEHRLSDKTILEHRMSGETQKMIRQNQISTEVQEDPAGIREISTGIQTVNRIVNRQLMQTEARTHRAEENLFRQIRLSENITKAARVESLLNQITVRDDVHLLKTILKHQRTNGNISAVITQTNAQRQFDIRQRDILTYNEAEPALASLKHADPALIGHPAPTTAQTLKTQAPTTAQTLKTQAAASAQPLRYLAKEQSARKPYEQEAFLNPIQTELQYLKKKEMAGAEALREQKQNVKVLMEKINIQEQVIDQMKNARQGQNTALGKAEVKMVADTVLERLYKDIHLQRLRMGMS